MNFLLKIRENLVNVSSNSDFMPKSIKMEKSANIFLADCVNWKVPIAPTLFRMNLLFKIREIFWWMWYQIAISCQNQSRWRQQLIYFLADRIYWESSNCTYTLQKEPALQDKRDILVNVISNSDFMPKSIKMETTANIYFGWLRKKSVLVRCKLKMAVKKSKNQMTKH